MSVVRRPFVNNFSVYALAATILIGSSSNLHRMFVSIISRTSSNMGHVGLISRSPGQKVGQICRNLVYKLEATYLAQTSSNLIRMFILIISGTSLNMGQVGSKSRSVGQILGKPCLHSTGHIFYPIFFKVSQDVYLDNVWDKFEYGLGRVKK